MGCSFSETPVKLTSMKKAKEAFQVPGLPQFNPDVFSDEEFLPSEVSNRPLGNWNEDPTGETYKELQMPLSIEKKAAEGITSANSLKNKSPPDGSKEEAEGARISPLNTFHLSKAKTAFERGRADRRLEVVTCSQFKSSLLNITKKNRAKEII
jgi:hypothetical protein